MENKKNLIEQMKKELGYKNVMQVPRILKIVVSCGVGSSKDKKRHEVVTDRLAKITGQKPVPRGAKKSIAGYKTRTGDIIGYQVTLRGSKMRGFLDKLINAALPRAKDFRGLALSSLDDMGNLTIGIKEHTIFPETSDEDLKDVFGMGITFVTTAKNRQESLAYFRILGFPFKKNK